MGLNTTRKLSLAIKVGLLMLAGTAWWLTEQRQADFGEAYSFELQKLHNELSVEAIDFSDDSSFIVFEVLLETYPHAQTKEYLDTLASDVNKVYCAQLAKSKHDLKIKLLHVNIRAISNANEANIIFSRALSDGGCTLPVKPA